MISTRQKIFVYSDIDTWQIIPSSLFHIKKEGGCQCSTLFPKRFLDY